MSNRILIVEDDPAIRLGLKRSLEFEGFTVELARDGEEAVQRAFDVKPDLIVLDLMLPKLNGFEVCRTVRKYDASIPVVILSAKGDEGDKVLGLELGADDYITKPFSIRELTARIKAALRRRKALEGEVETFDEEGVKIDFGAFKMIVNGVDHEQQGVPPAAVPDPEPRARALPRPDPEQGLGLRLRRHAAHDRQLHQQAAPEARARPAQPEVDPDGPGQRLPLQGAGRVVPQPFRTDPGSKLSGSVLILDPYWLDTYFFEGASHRLGVRKRSYSCGNGIWNRLQRADTSA
jgi:CheY-like chemotaxis protein